MLERNESKWNSNGVTAAEISAAIRYLDSGPCDEIGRDTNNAILVTYVILMFLLSSLAFTCLYCKAG